MSGKSKVLILSGAYIGQEMAAELGRLPPAFLPVGSKRLIELQVESLSESDEIWLSLPATFEIDVYDQVILDELKVNILRVPDNISLRESLIQVLKSFPEDTPIKMLHGDTLIADIPDGEDIVSTVQVRGNYDWAYVIQHNGMPQFAPSEQATSANRDILCGFFSFSSSALLQRALIESSGFVSALNAYNQYCSLRTSDVSQWYDFGHLPLYYQSKCNMLTARSFNNLRSDGKVLTKLSQQTTKMRAEAAWYENLPTELQLYSPKFLGPTHADQMAGYKLEYLFLPTLAEIFVLGALPAATKELIINSALESLAIYGRLLPSADAPESADFFAKDFHDIIYVKKTWSRMEAFLQQRNWGWGDTFLINGMSTPSMRDIIEKCLASVPPTTTSHVSYWHGDFFFGNLFFDFRANRVIAVDPRGTFEGGAPSAYGDKRYDLSKLAHSIIGCYDWIIAGRYKLGHPEERIFELEIGDGNQALNLNDWFLEIVQERFGIDRNEILSLTALLFFSMLPLHADSEERQLALLANGLRIAMMLS